MLKKFKMNLMLYGNLIQDIDYYDPKILKTYFMRNHYTTNSIEGLFGNIKQQAEHKMLPLHEVLKLFINQCENLIKENINFKHSVLNKNISSQEYFGEYAIRILNERYDECIEILNMLNNKDVLIQDKAHKIIDSCKCVYDDLPCIHVIFNIIITANGTTLFQKMKFQKNIIYNHGTKQIK